MMHMMESTTGAVLLMIALVVVVLGGLLAMRFLGERAHEKGHSTLGDPGAAPVRASLEQRPGDAVEDV